MIYVSLLQDIPKKGPRRDIPKKDAVLYFDAYGSTKRTLRRERPEW